MKGAFAAVVYTALFMLLLEYVAQIAPEYAGRAAFGGVILAISVFGYAILRRIRKVREDVAVLDHKVNRINTTVVDIQQNPLVEFKVDPTTKRGRRGGMQL